MSIEKIIVLEDDLIVRKNLEHQLRQRRYDVASVSTIADAQEYLRSLTYDGAAKRYPKMDEMVRDRIEFELETIHKMGFPGYFLIVWDVIRAAREMGVSVGPGRGSAEAS